MRIDHCDDDRNLLLPPFAAADDSRAQIAKYITRGEVLVAHDGDLLVGHFQGFRMCKIVRAAFVPSKGYLEGTLVDGVLLRDRVFFS